MWEKSIRDDGTFSRTDFCFDAQGNTYECPGGKKLTSTGRPTNAGTVLFRARDQDCGSCARAAVLPYDDLKEITPDRLEAFFKNSLA